MSSQIKLISIVIPVHNEQDFLTKCFAAIEKAKQQIQIPLEIIVVLNRCSDASEEIARAAGCRIESNDAKNLSIIRNTGVQAASGDIIVTVDADSLVSPNILKNILAALTSGKYIGGGVLIIPDRFSFGIMFSMLLLLPFAIYWGISAGVFYARRETWQQLGGFDENLYSAEDVDFGRRLKALGKREGKRYKNLFLSYIITSSRKFDRFGDWFVFSQPLEVLRLLRGRKSGLADKLWYDFNSK